MYSFISMYVYIQCYMFCAIVCLWRSEDSFWDLVLFFCLVEVQSLLILPCFLLQIHWLPRFRRFSCLYHLLIVGVPGSQTCTMVSNFYMGSRDLYSGHYFCVSSAATHRVISLFLLLIFEISKTYSRSWVFGGYVIL